MPPLQSFTLIDPTPFSYPLLIYQIYCSVSAFLTEMQSEVVSAFTIWGGSHTKKSFLNYAPTN